MCVVFCDIGLDYDEISSVIDGSDYFVEVDGGLAPLVVDGADEAMKSYCWDIVSAF